jgi:hypothetical protein
MVFQEPHLGVACGEPDAIEHRAKALLAKRAEGRDLRIRRKGFLQNVTLLKAQPERTQNEAS